MAVLENHVGVRAQGLAADQVEVYLAHGQSQGSALNLGVLNKLSGETFGEGSFVYSAPVRITRRMDASPPLMESWNQGWSTSSFAISYWSGFNFRLHSLASASDSTPESWSSASQRRPLMSLPRERSSSTIMLI